MLPCGCSEERHAAGLSCLKKEKTRDPYRTPDPECVERDKVIRQCSEHVLETAAHLKRELAALIDECDKLKESLKASLR